MYASLLISLIVAFVAMLAKQWINQYLWSSSGSTIERCRNRQRKFDGVRKWSPHIFLTYLLWMLQIAVYLLIDGLYVHIWNVNAPVANTVLSFLGLTGLSYTVIVGIGSLSYVSPFQTPLSGFFRACWRVIASIVHPKRALSQIRRVLPPLPRQSLPTTVSLENVELHQPKPWIKPKDLADIHQRNLNDVACVLWILRYTTDPEALDAAIRFAITIRWSDDGTDIDPPYNLIVFIFEECFDSTGKLYPGSRDRAYYSGQAILWIHTQATMCKSEDPVMELPLLSIDRVPPGLDDDLSHLLQVIYMAGDPNRCIGQLLRINPRHTSAYSRWISNLLLHYSWANRTKLDYGYILDRVSETHETETTIPLEATLNRLLVWSIFLGSPVEEEVLEIQDKLYGIFYFFSRGCSPPVTSTFIGRILDQLSEAVLSAINGTPTQRGFIPPMLRDLVNLKNHLSSSSLQRPVIRSVELIGHEGFEGVGMERFIGLLNHLHVTVEDMDDQSKWAKLLLGIIRTPEGAQRLSQPYWELLVEVAILIPQSLRDVTAYDPQITESLIQAREWRRLECWMATVWMIWPPGAGGITEEDLGRFTPPLFQQRPDAGQKLEQWMERWSQTNHEDIPELFQQICTRAQQEVQFSLDVIF